MSEESYPEQLNLFSQYRRAVKLKRTTSRMSNKDWYRDALELDVQLHCYYANDKEVDCYLHIRSSQIFEEIGRLSMAAVQRREDLEKFLSEILQRPSVKKSAARSLGVVCYIADEVSFAGLGPEYNDASELPELARLVESDPKEVLEDKTASLKDYSWRLFPYLGVKGGSEFAVAVAEPRHIESFLQTFRSIGDERNFPVRTCALSAALLGVASLPWTASISPAGTVAVYCYAKFTLLALFDTSCDLQMLRHIPHAQGSKLPRNLGPTVFSAATAFELENPDVYVFPMAGENTQNVALNLQTALKESQIMQVDARDIAQSRGIGIDLPLEMMTTTHELDPKVYPLAGNETFQGFTEQGWAVQDFLPPTDEELSRVPDAKAMEIMKWALWSKRVAFITLVATLLFTSFDLFRKTTSSSWAQKGGANSVTMLKGLQQKVNDHQRWHSFFQDRSKGWVSMELLSHLSPEDGSVMLKDSSHAVSVLPAVNGASGLRKTWTINGGTTEKGLTWLEKFNAVNGKQMKQIFRDVAKLSGNEAYNPDLEGRDMNVTFTYQNKSSGSGRAARGRKNQPVPADSMPYSFTLKIIQTYAASDPLALVGKQIAPVAKKGKKR